jgi:hypothetical protein
MMEECGDDDDGRGNKGGIFLGGKLCAVHSERSEMELSCAAISEEINATLTVLWDPADRLLIRSNPLELRLLQSVAAVELSLQAEERKKAMTSFKVSTIDIH